MKKWLSTLSMLLKLQLLNFYEKKQKPFQIKQLSNQL